ncbi:MAG: hypothetical protein KIG18_03850 [Candidatus Methanomethylophilaceae archaeon]|nr:hypothetical protein [Candidatus Methanomethylophilaceae archaeon]
MMEAYIMSLDEEVDRGLEYVKLICGFDYANDVIKMLLSGFCISNNDEKLRKILEGKE